MSDAQIAALTAYCPDLDRWPQRWQFDEHDIPPGQRIELQAALAVWYNKLSGGTLMFSVRNQQ